MPSILPGDSSCDRLAPGQTVAGGGGFLRRITMSLFCQFASCSLALARSTAEVVVVLDLVLSPRVTPGRGHSGSVFCSQIRISWTKYHRSPQIFSSQTLPPLRISIFIYCLVTVSHIAYWEKKFALFFCPCSTYGRNSWFTCPATSMLCVICSFPSAAFEWQVRPLPPLPRRV